MTNFKLILYKIYTNRYKKYVLDIIMSLAYLSKSQMFYFMFYFRLGVAIYSVSSRLIIIGQVIFIYLLLCQLDLISPFIKVDQVFEFIDYI